VCACEPETYLGGFELELLEELDLAFDLTQLHLALVHVLLRILFDECTHASAQL
jgi:hypothetical protein